MGACLNLARFTTYHKATLSVDIADIYCDGFERSNAASFADVQSEFIFRVADTKRHQETETVKVASQTTSSRTVQSQQH